MKIFITGATGFVGGFILRELKKQGHTARCLVRNAEQSMNSGLKDEDIAIGDATNPDSLRGLLSGCDAVIHLVAIIEENKKKSFTFENVNFHATVNMVHAAQEQGVSRFIHMSALGADPNGATPYFRSKGRAENYVKASGLAYTIFRPSFIYGNGDAVYTLLANVIRRTPFGLMPIFGNGRYRHQPIHAESLAKGMVNSFSEKRALKNIYEAGGPEPVSYRDQLIHIGEAIGKTVRMMPLPLWLGRILVGILGRFRFFPMDSDKLEMLISENTCDPAPFSNDLGVTLETFEFGIKYLAG